MIRGGGEGGRERERELFGLMPGLNRSSRLTVQCRGVEPLDFPQPTTVHYMLKPDRVPGEIKRSRDLRGGR